MSDEAVVKMAGAGLVVTHELLGDTAVDLLAMLRYQMATTPEERQLLTLSEGRAAVRQLRWEGYRLNPADLAEHRDDLDECDAWDVMAWREFFAWRPQRDGDDW